MIHWIENNEFKFNVDKQSGIIHIDYPMEDNSKISAKFIPIN